MIVDTHAHLGWDEVFDEEFTEEELVESQEKNKIGATIVQPAIVNFIEGARKIHDRIFDLSKRYPGRFYGMANPNPHLPDDIYKEEILRCIDELNFLGIKLNPFAHAVNPLGRDGRKVFSIANKLKVPVMVHTGSGIPWAAPSILHKIAEDYPDLKIVVAHAGGMILANEAGQLARKHKNIFLECSWTPGFIIKQWIKDPLIGKEKIMFGSDHADNAPAELIKYRTLGLTEEELEWVLGKTACVVFGIRCKN